MNHAALAFLYPEAPASVVVGRRVGGLLRRPRVRVAALERGRPVLLLGGLLRAVVRGGLAALERRAALAALAAVAAGDVAHGRELRVRQPEQAVLHALELRGRDDVLLAFGEARDQSLRR